MRVGATLLVAWVMDLFPIPAAAIPERLVMAGNWWEKESEKKGNAKKKTRGEKLGELNVYPPFLRIVHTYQVPSPGGRRICHLLPLLPIKNW